KGPIQNVHRHQEITRNIHEREALILERVSDFRCDKASQLFKGIFTMKGFKILTCTAAASMMMLGGRCNKDFLDRNPENSVSGEIFWKSQTDVETALAGVYYRLQENFLGYERVYFDALTHNAFPDPGNNTQPNLGSMTIGAISPGLGGVM